MSIASYFVVLDAMGKPPSQLLNYHLHWLGSYEECVAIEATVNVSGQLNHPYKGRYCSATFPFSQVSNMIMMIDINLLASPLHNAC